MMSSPEGSIAARLVELESPITVISVGLPAAGKTTFLRELANELCIARVCPDDIRKELTGNAGDQSVSGQAWSEAHARVQEELHGGRSVILDATNTNALLRGSAIRKFRSAGALSIIAAVFDIPLEVAQQRNSTRALEYYVPHYYINEAHASLLAEPPTTAEGFDEIILINR